VARAHPRHLALGALVAGLVACAAWGAAVAAVAAGVVTRRARLAVLCGALALAGAWVGTERREAIDRAPVAQWIDHSVTARGYLTRRERPSRGVRRARVRLTSLRADGGWVRIDDLVQVRARPGTEFPPAAIGDELEVAGELAEPRNPPGGDFDYVAYLRRAGVHALFYAEEVTATGRRRAGTAGLVDQVRRRAQAGVRAGLDPAPAALAEGIVLGQDERIPQPIADDFRDSGLAHLLAVSGQNVVLLSLLALPVLAALGYGRRARLVGVLALIALYVPLTGAGPSILRAGAMGAAGTIAALAGRPASRWYALLLAAVFTLVVDPRAWLDPGWQLSFAAVVGILALAPRITDGLGGLPQPLAAGIAVTVAATIATAPLIAYQFERVSLVGLGANLAAMPAVAPAMWLGTVAATAGQVSPAIAALVNALNGYVLAYIAAVAQVAAGMPGAVWTVGLGTPLALAAAYVTLAAALWRRTRLPAVLLALAVLIPLPAGSPARADGFTVTFLDVGQGEATLLQAPGEVDVLVDGGPPDADLVGKLQKAGVRSLDLVFLSHPALDHEGGLEPVLRELPVGAFVDGAAGSRDAAHRRVLASAHERGVDVTATSAGDAIRLGRLRLRVLSPDQQTRDAASDPNESALVLLASFEGFDVLLPADAESDVMLPLQLPPVEVLKVAHHGSEDPGLPALLERLNPSMAVIEVGAHNRYGHPHPSTLRALAAAGVPVRRTDREGDVRVSTLAPWPTSSPPT
jgi:competence protein ComEC